VKPIGAWNNIEYEYTLPRPLSCNGDMDVDPQAVHTSRGGNSVRWQRSQTAPSNE
jgi:hypothetical protein